MTEKPPIRREGDLIVFHVPMHLERRGGRKLIMTPPGPDAPPRRRKNAAGNLTVLLARAYRWQEVLESGRYADIGELATAIDVNREHVARVLRLAFLAPDIVEAILEGKRPDLTWQYLRTNDIPVLWEDQRKQLGKKPRKRKKKGTKS